MIFINSKIKDYTKQMPALPVSAKRVLEICGSMNTNAYDLNHIISLDPVLTGRILQLLIVSYKGLGPHITSLVRALTMLGINTVKNLAIDAAEQSLLPKNASIEGEGIDLTAFWRHSLCVALITRHLAYKQRIDPLFHEEYFISGLLHDIGMLPLNYLFPREYASLKTAVSGNNPILSAEKKLVGFHHCKAGETIAKAWKLEWPVADVLAWHHEPSLYSGKNSSLLYTVTIADYYSSLMNMSFLGHEKPEKPDFHIWLASGIKEDDFDSFKGSVFDEINKAQKFLNLS